MASLTSTQTWRSLSGAEREVDCSVFDGGRIIRHISTLPAATDPLVTGREDVEHYEVGEGGAVPDGLHSGDRLLFLQECGRLGPKE